MKKHLTDICIQNVRPPKSGSAEIFDLGYPGLGIRIGNGGAKTFQIFYRVNGKLRRERLGRWPAISLAAARDAWRKTHEAIARGEAPSREGAKQHGPLFDSIVEEWLKRDQSQNKASSLYQTTRIVESDLLPAWRGRAVDQIGKRDIIALLDSVSDRSPSAARKVQASIFRFFAWCMERDILTVNPTVSIPRIEAVASRERVLGDDEVKQIWAATADTTDPYNAACRLLLLTGLRREEVGQLKWSEIENGTIHLEGNRTKTGAPHDVHLSAPARELLDSMRRFANCDWVFTPTGSRPLQSWSQAKARLDQECGVTDWRYHDLRRTVATGMEKLGIALPVTEAVLGHTGGSRGGIVKVYQRHQYQDEKRAALDLWAKHVAKLVGELT